LPFKRDLHRYTAVWLGADLRPMVAAAMEAYHGGALHVESS
jgi:hypothetical protein